MLKKILLFSCIFLFLCAAVLGFCYKYLYSPEYYVFLESLEHGVMTVDSGETVGTDKKYRVSVKNGDTLTVNINPERDDDVYYDLKSITVNGEDVTEDVRMLQYRFKVTQKSNIVATFKKGKRPEETSNASKLKYPDEPIVSVTNSTPYLGSVGAYDFKDPSVIFDEQSGYYYAFGSDNAVARSKDLINWSDRTTYFKTPDAAESAEVMDFLQFRSVYAWAKRHGYSDNLSYSSVVCDRTPLAPEIVKVDETYYLYFSLSKIQDANESAIFCVSTRDLEAAVSTKTWNECGLVFSTCGRIKGTPLEDGEKVKSSKYDESNAVHPSVLKTDDGKLYLAYGSYFGKESLQGGVYLLELDPETGLLKKDSVFNSQGKRVSTLHEDEEENFKTGVLIARPGRVPALSKNEGSLISACELAFRDGYYYLFMTYGVEEKNYEIRVARSKKIDGPYVDSNGNEMNKFSRLFGKNQYEKGNLIAAGYNFTRSSGGGVAYSNIGKAATGSPCVFETRDGKWMMSLQSQVYFKVNNTLMTGEQNAEKFEEKADALPSMETRSVIWSESDWPLILPEMYAKEKTTTGISSNQMYGNWDIVKFEKAGDEEDYAALACNRSTPASFFGGVTISRNDAKNGTEIKDLGFSRRDDRSYEILLDGEKYTVYPVLAWDWELSEGTLCFTGMSESGDTVWGKKTSSAYMGIYSDTFYYLLSQVDGETRAEYEEKLEEISANPSQEQLDELSAQLVKKALLQSTK